MKHAVEIRVGGVLEIRQCWRVPQDYANTVARDSQKDGYESLPGREGFSADVLSSSVAKRTVKHFGLVDMIVADQLFAQRKLVAVRLPSHLKNGFSWTDKLLWLFMALNTPLHVERIHLQHKRHLINAPMTDF